VVCELKIIQRPPEDTGRFTTFHIINNKGKDISDFPVIPLNDSLEQHIYMTDTAGLLSLNASLYDSMELFVLSKLSTRRVLFSGAGLPKLIEIRLDIDEDWMSPWNIRYFGDRIKRFKMENGKLLNSWMELTEEK
jgi:hypothetical protein